MRVTEMVEPLGQGCQTRTLVQPDQAFGEPLLSGRLTEREEDAVRSFLSGSMASGFPAP